MLYVIFTNEGQPEWIGPEPRDGSEEIDGLDLEFLVAHVRTPDGNWVPRPAPPPPTEAELAELARVEAENQARAEAEWERWIKAEIARRAQPDVLQYLMGNITQEELRAREAETRAAVESGN
jgi:hypothetical protein